MSTRVSCRLSLPACFLVLASGMACCPLASDALSVDINSRESVRAFYNTYYTASDAAIGWVGGDIAACNEGDTSQAFKDDTLLRVNWFRVMAGLPEVTWNPTWADDCQKAALVQSRNNMLDHRPSSTCECWTVVASNAAHRSNLSAGSIGYDAVANQMRDQGVGNEFCGHRRWILDPRAQKTGSGSVPNSGAYEARMALYVFDGFDNSRPRQAIRGAFVSWPPAGYVPYQTVYGRWSFSISNADFSSASVSMTANGSSIPVTLDDRTTTLYGDNTIVWRPNGMASDLSWPKPTADSNYVVSLTNVIIGGTPQAFNYTVTVFDPAVGGAAPPNQPTNVRASNGTYVNYVLVQWDTADGATFYQVWRSTDNDPDNAVLIKDHDLDQTYNDNHAVPEQVYYYFVRAGNEDGYSDFSVGNSGWAALDTPDAPTGLLASDGTHEDKVAITWHAVDGATWYQTWRNNSNSLKGAVTIGSGFVNSMNDYTATPGTWYYYWARAENQNGWSAYSGSDSGYVAVAHLPPDTPSAFWASDGTYGNKIYLMAQIPPGTTGFDFWRGKLANRSDAVRIVENHPSGEYSDADVVPGFHYWYWAQARNENGVSDFSEGDDGYASVLLNPPPTPEYSASQGTYPDRVNVEWSAVAAVDHYELWCNSVNSSSTATRIGVLDPSVYQSTHSPLGPGTTNYYFVTATNRYGRSPFHAGAKGYTKPAVNAPTGLQATDGNHTGSVLVSWNPVPYARYSVWRHTLNNPAAASCIATDLSQHYHIDYTAVPDQVYYYWAKAFISPVTSEFSNVDTGYAGKDNPPPAPGNVQATRGVYKNFIRVTWEQVLDADWYELWRNTTADTGTATRRNPHCTQAYDDDPAPSWLIGYYYWVRSVNENGTSDWSAATFGYMAGPMSVPELRYGNRLGNIWVLTMSNLTVGLTNYIQSTTNLMPGSQWIQRGALNPSKDTSFWFGLMPGEQRYYRIVVEPPLSP